MCVYLPTMVVRTCTPYKVRKKRRLVQIGLPFATADTAAAVVWYDATEARVALGLVGESTLLYCVCIGFDRSVRWSVSKHTHFVLYCARLTTAVTLLLYSVACTFIQSFDCLHG